MASLFDDLPDVTGPYAMAAIADPATSHAAAERHERSGLAETNRKIVLALVRDYPGSTSVELHAAQGDRSHLDRHEVSRRLADLKNAGIVQQGDAKECSIKRTAMVSWWLS